MIHSDFLTNLVEQEVRSHLWAYGNIHIEQTAKLTVLLTLLFPLLSSLTCSLVISLLFLWNESFRSDPIRYNSHYMFATWLEKKIQPLFGCVCWACVVKLHYTAVLFGVEQLIQSVLCLACPTSIANPPVFRELRLCPDATSLSAQVGLHGQQPILTSWGVQANWENKFLEKLVCWVIQGK